MSDDIKKKFDDIIDSIKKDLESTAKKIEEYLDRGEAHKAYRVWRDNVLYSLKTLKKALDSISDELRNVKLSEEELHKLADRIKDGVKEVINKIEDLNDKLKESRGRRFIATFFNFKPCKHVLHEIIGGVEVTIDRLLDSVEKMVIDIERSIEDIGKRVTQVVSVRIKEQDLEIIDRLVDAGIFKSRSEAIAYFAKKGIESSKEWIEKALEQARKIKELQESIRREIEQEGNEEHH